ncbi:hypothetical protein [Deinococcus peraridilitoris]|uniref:hypothetical protein n=1 Tax=Deinococcus peraridilitoris TaxID=432329 RepID=UPI000301CC75|nr:hypothetical protein [Deinococcus peraridilitoris]
MGALTPEFTGVPGTLGADGGEAAGGLAGSEFTGGEVMGMPGGIVLAAWTLAAALTGTP